MTDLPKLVLTETNLDQINDATGRIVVFVPESGKLDQFGRRLNRLMKGALERFVESMKFSKMKEGDSSDLAFPTGLHAEAVQVVRLDRRSNPDAERRAGAAIGGTAKDGDVLILAGGRQKIEHLVMGCVLKAYEFTAHKSSNESTEFPEITLMVSKPNTIAADIERVEALAEGVYFTRDLVNEPANVLTTVTFAERLKELRGIGLKVQVLDEDELEQLGMRTLLAVGYGSETPSKVVVMEWMGSGIEAPLALVGKGVVFDTGGISLKPAGGMEDMTMDMGGAGTVAGVMKALALRKAAANVVGIVGLVENMPDGRAQRPGDVVRSMKGDTVEVINTDAEGRLVLCDIMWYAQERFEPRAMIDLATLTGAVIIALGHENAGVFSNDDTLANSFLSAAQSEAEGAWRLPLGDGYARALKSRVGDVKNVGGRPAGSITAAEFLHCFVKEDVPWIHLD
ncbi:MAG: leucyl aminopeptidase, partial [Boseongicola sp.]|nr:leucyl aminopeptidase [Boseongicola sp.]